MPAWMTSELRELVWVPMASSASRITTSRPDRARLRATARPTAPAPTTTASSFSTQQEPFKKEGAQAGSRGDRRHRPRGAVERGAEPRADERAAGKADESDQRRSGAGRGGERRHDGGGRVRDDER